MLLISVVHARRWKNASEIGDDFFANKQTGFFPFGHLLGHLNLTYYFLLHQNRGKKQKSITKLNDERLSRQANIDAFPLGGDTGNKVEA